MLKNLISRVLMPSFEKDLNRVLGKEMRRMEDMMGAMSPQVYSFEPVVASRGGLSGSAGGAFGRSSATMDSAKIVRVNRQFENKGMFHE